LQERFRHNLIRKPERLRNKLVLVLVRSKLAQEQLRSKALVLVLARSKLARAHNTPRLRGVPSAWQTDRRRTNA